MAKIHGLAYVIIGIFISIASWKINYENLYFFFYFGILFIGVGAAKLLLSLIKNKKEGQETAHQKTLHYQSQRLHQQKHHYKRCPRCHNVMRFNDRFCSKCGARI